MDTIKLTRQRIHTFCLNQKMDDHERLSWCRTGVIDHNDENWLDPGWHVQDIEVVSVKPDPRNKPGHHNQMDIVKALVTETKTEVL